ncbi:hypothetical protein JCM16418_2509 [Paenibacillus pini JCM 16418]|uniref:Uncharacterized protein n=1 Tax=Paenibacillus pini JCM 16418 TaxID=1236976 RepID=W7YC31_9BACL|nr:hypothetical protein JCM16418_2509 [Paenibacillus pini JCM 16418]
MEDVKQQSHQTMEWNGTAYEITYYPNKGSHSVKVPKNKHYTISGDNMDGIILTVSD